MEDKENLLDLVGYHKKWHGTVQNFRKPYKFNQNDFLIKEIFQRIGIKNGFFVEFGAWDGIFGSNTRKLFLDGWGGILIEPHPERFEDLMHNYEDCERVTTLNKAIGTHENLFDNVVREHVNEQINFCSIDIDGLDVEVFETIEEFLPDVICIEGGQMLSPFYKKRLSTEIAAKNIQQGLYTMNQIFENKGYKLLCTYQDSFFIKEKHFHLFNVKEDLLELYLDGILAYPRLPWVSNKLKQAGLNNEIVNLIISKTNFINPHAPEQEKIAWVDSNYDVILQVTEKIRDAYHKSIKDKNI